MHCCRVTSVLVLLTFLAAPAVAQVCGSGTLTCNSANPPAGTGSRVETALINVFLGGLTAGVSRGVRGKPLLRGFAAGAAGGALVYGGKRLTVERWPGAGLAGRQLAALGSSVVWNSSAGRAPLGRLMLPAGPVRLYVETGPHVRVQPRVDVAGLAAVVALGTRSGTRLDWSATLSAGAPVFHRVAALEVAFGGGDHLAGVVEVLVPRGGPGAKPEYIREAEAHERVHVLQHDQSFLFWGSPAEDALLDWSSAGRTIHRWVDLGVNVAATSAANAVVEYDSRPWEREAHLLSGTRWRK